MIISPTGHPSGRFYSENVYTPEEFKHLVLQKYQFPSGVRVRGHVDLSRTDVERLPEDLYVEGFLELSWCYRLQSLPKGLRVSRFLSLSYCIRLSSLPEDLRVGGDICIDNCINLTSLPSWFERLGKRDDGQERWCNLHGSGLPFSTLERLKTASTEEVCFECPDVNPEIFTPSFYSAITPSEDWVSQTYFADDFEKLIQEKHQFLPGVIRVLGKVSLDESDIESLPGPLHVKGNLYLENTQRLTRLPQYLLVEGSFNLEMSSVTELPSHLYVLEDLELAESAISSLPEVLQVGRDIDISYCCRITSLPSYITTLGPRLDGETRIVDVQCTGLSQAIIVRLEGIGSDGMQFFTSMPPRPQQQKFRMIEMALAFWAEVAECKKVPELVLSDVYLPSILTFLGRLVETKEYQNSNTRKSLAHRVLDAFEQMAENAEIKERACDILYHGIASCDDRIIAALDDVDLMICTYMLEKLNVSKDLLREKARPLLLLQMVDEAAKKHLETLMWVDEVEVYLRFRIGLAEKLGLPIFTRNMYFHACAQISDKVLDEIGNTILKECTEEKLDAFLETWTPWILQQKRKAFPDYETLEEVASTETICCLTQEPSSELIMYGDNVYDYNSFKRCFELDGKDPFTKSFIDLSKLKRINRRFSCK